MTFMRQAHVHQFTWLNLIRLICSMQRNCLFISLDVLPCPEWSILPAPRVMYELIHTSTCLSQPLIKSTLFWSDCLARTDEVYFDGWIQNDRKLWHRDKRQRIALVLNNSAIRCISSEDSSNGTYDRDGLLYYIWVLIGAQVDFKVGLGA